MQVYPRNALFAFILLLIGSLILSQGEGWFGWEDVVRGNISVFIFTVTVMYITFSHNQWVREKEKEDMYKGVLKGIYKEIVERTRIIMAYLQMIKAKQGPTIIQIAPFPGSAWDTAIAKGYYQPNNQSWVYYAYVYNATDNINHILKVANEIALTSTLTQDTYMPIVEEQLLTVLTAISEVLVIIPICTKELEKELGITKEEIKKTNEEIRIQIEKALASQGAGGRAGGD